MTALARKRRAIRHLLNDQRPADAMSSYFALHHPESKTQLITYPAEAVQPIGYVAFSRTGMDLFRPLMTFRLPLNDLEAGAAVIEYAVPPETAVILSSPARDYPLIKAMFDIHSEEYLQLYVFDPARYEPIINVMVAEELGPNGLPRFVVRHNENGQQVVVAAAGLNWLSPHFGEISVTTSAQHRRRGWGRSVVSAMVGYLLGNGRIPLYSASLHNEPSIQLAERVGFTQRNIQQLLVQATRL